MEALQASLKESSKVKLGKRKAKTGEKEKQPSAV
jgi:hypothetical protein